MRKITITFNLSDLVRYLSAAAYVGAVVGAAGMQAKLGVKTGLKMATTAACGTVIAMWCSDVFWDVHGAGNWLKIDDDKSKKPARAPTPFKEDFNK